MNGKTGIKLRYFRQERVHKEQVDYSEPVLQYWDDDLCGWKDVPTVYSDDLGDRRPDDDNIN